LGRHLGLGPRSSRQTSRLGAGLQVGHTHHDHARGAQDQRVDLLLQRHDLNKNGQLDPARPSSPSPPGRPTVLFRSDLRGPWADAQGPTRPRSNSRSRKSGALASAMLLEFDLEPKPKHSLKVRLDPKPPKGRRRSSWKVWKVGVCVPSIRCPHHHRSDRWSLLLGTGNVRVRSTKAQKNLCPPSLLLINPLPRAECEGTSLMGKKETVRAGPQSQDHSRRCTRACDHETSSPGVCVAECLDVLDKTWGRMLARLRRPFSCVPSG
jgi:hypothetical protein